MMASDVDRVVFLPEVTSRIFVMTSSTHYTKSYSPPHSTVLDHDSDTHVTPSLGISGQALD